MTSISSTNELLEQKTQFSSALRMTPQQTHLGPGSGAGVHSPEELVSWVAGHALDTGLQGQAQRALQRQAQTLGFHSQAPAQQGLRVALETWAPWQGWMAGHRGALAGLHGDSGEERVKGTAAKSIA